MLGDFFFEVQELPRSCLYIVKLIRKPDKDCPRVFWYGPVAKKTACPSDSLLQTSLLRESQMRCPFAERNVNPGPGVNAVKWNQNLVFGEFGEKRLTHFKQRIQPAIAVYGH